MHSEEKTLKLSLSGPHDRVYRWLSFHPQASITHLRRNEGLTNIDTISCIVHLPYNQPWILEQITSYNLDYKVLALDGYLSSCPLIQSALSKDKR